MIEIRFLGRIDLRATPGQVRGAERTDVAELIRQPKRIALLAYLLLSPDGGSRRRDTLLALLWPELDSAHARAALRQLVHHLRRMLGQDAILSVGDDDLRLNEDVVLSDVRTLEGAVARSRHAEALEQYGGDLLAGFYVKQVAPEFEQWLDGERERLRSVAMKSAWTLADHSVDRRDAASALLWARRAMAIAPDDESALRRFLIVCDKVGERYAAVRTYEDFAARMRRELDVDPSPETQQIVRRIRERIDPRFSGEWLPPGQRRLAAMITPQSLVTPPDMRGRGWTARLRAFVASLSNPRR